jgi:Cupin-like domain
MTCPGSSNNHEGDIYYLQSQNGNLYPSSYFTPADTEGGCELVNLRGDVPAEVPWCSEALGRCPDAVNLWIGDSRSVTSIHSGQFILATFLKISLLMTQTDPYENIYHVARGSKTFLLLPPTESWCLKGSTLENYANWLAMLNIVSRAPVSSCNIQAGVGRFPPAPETFTLYNTTSSLVIDITSRTTRISTRYITPYNHSSRGRGNVVSSSRLVAPCPTIWPIDRT